MSGLIIMRTQLKKKNINKFLDINSNWTISIAKIYHMGSIIEIIYGVDLMGYAEPLDYYDEIKDYVDDLWYSVVGDVDLERGKDAEADEWHSCKKERKNKK